MRLKETVPKDKLEVFRKNSSAILPSLDMIILPRKKMKQLKFAELEKRFLEAIKKLSF